MRWQRSKAAVLRRLVARGSVVMPGVSNGAVALQAEAAGFEALYVSGAGLANSAGLPDISLLSLTEIAQLAGYIARAVTIPAIVDGDTGFGGPANTARAVQEFERAGLAGMHMEDQTFPKRCGHLGGKELVSTGEMVEKIRAAVAARDNPDFLIIARTDARAVEGFDGAVERAQLYLKAGADAIFPEALETAGEFRRFAKSIKSPLLANMTEFGKSPLLSARQLQRMGYRMVIFPMTAFRISMQATEACLVHLKKHGTQRQLLERMQTREELYHLLRYDPAGKKWPVF